MKKILAILSLMLLASRGYSQLLVDSCGHVGIGTEVPNSLLSIGSSGDSDVSAYLNNNRTTVAAYIRNTAPNTQDSCQIEGIHIYSSGDRGENYGVFSQACGTNTTACKISCGVFGQGSSSQNCIGIMGCGGSYTTQSLAGIYGSNNVLGLGTFSHQGYYAGYFKGPVRCTERIYASLFTPTSSNARNGENTSGEIISGENDERVLDRLQNVQTVQFTRKTPREDTTCGQEESTDSMSDEMKAYYEKEKLPTIQHGVIADQLKEVYPELVHEDIYGNVSINYIEMVPLLLQSIRELSSEVTTLKEKLGYEDKKVKATSIEDTTSDVDLVKMSQNKPNPFSESSVISLNIPDNVKQALIYIFDMNGKQVKTIEIPERGKTDITVHASDLNSGMYIYSLATDGDVCVTRKMIVSK